MTDTDDERPPTSFLADAIAARRGRRPDRPPAQQQESEEPEETAVPWFTDALRGRRGHRAGTASRLFNNPKNNPPQDAA